MSILNFTSRSYLKKGSVSSSRSQHYYYKRPKIDNSKKRNNSQRHRSVSSTLSDKNQESDENEQTKSKKSRLRRHQLSLRCSTWLNHYSCSGENQDKLSDSPQVTNKYRYRMQNYSNT